MLINLESVIQIFKLTFKMSLPSRDKIVLGTAGLAGIWGPVNFEESEQIRTHVHFNFHVVRLTIIFEATLIY